MTVFGMVTTRSTWEYTSYALKSFFRKTKLEPPDRLYLIDNDESFEEEASWFSPQLEILKNRSPLSFAANVNQIMQIAAKENSDLFFLNNDVIFTDGWIDPLRESRDAILSPVSNAEAPYEVGGVKWTATMKLSEYLGKEAVLRELVKQHKTTITGERKVVTLPFFCVKIPHPVYSVVGPMDETFGRGSAEDSDYCIRAWLEGFSVGHALQSYVLHFRGKSALAGETEEESAERLEKCSTLFTQKWGSALAAYVLHGNSAAIDASGELLQIAQSQDFKTLIEKLRQTN